ncbi:Hypothetical protein IALB_0099 [Ignavibacterium album JCM 16511]|uniref:Uncharacterized protein n=1 Tax=Ignavibacterium album (strain DSM 19864 / JCM 16511 / NBRC 101810 / Mat9-16) TaxID=945713 RepID=I0AFQ6_IGNAJ|nr:hypothetical protein [Ignavibacterium album]AFH47813.1 Hypothetical protein IALB_0099 [Ignavibacterium album JCM 16511]
MEMLARIVGSIMMDVIPEADNAYEAIDRYCAILYKRIKLKDNAGIDYERDLELFLFLNGYKSKIAEIVHKQTVAQRGGLK